MDTGGYGRLELRMLSRDRFLLRGSIESYLVDTRVGQITVADSVLGESEGKVLGAFDANTDGDWSFSTVSGEPAHLGERPAAPHGP
jgi:hypothetical protein